MSPALIALFTELGPEIAKRIFRWIETGQSLDDLPASKLLSDNEKRRMRRAVALKKARGGG